MIKYISFLFTFLISSSVFAQISIEDSTVQMVGYWSIGDKQSYTVSHEKYKVVGTDTSSREIITYDINITIKDSTAKSYLIEWFYTNFEVETENELVKKIMSISEDLPVLIKTDEFGAILEVVNWEEVRDRTKKATKILKKELKKIPNSEAIFAQISNLYETKASVEANAIKDAQQFYTFHGAAYTLGEQLSVQTQVPNGLGDKPFDVELNLMLTEIDEEEQNSVIRMTQVVDPKQLTDATYAYLKKLDVTGNLPKRSEYPSLTNETATASRIHGPSGWVIYSIETKTVSTAGIIKVEERIIELK